MSDFPSVRANAVIVNGNGLHARPADLLVRAAMSFASEIVFTCKGQSANGKSIMALLSLGAAQGTVVTVEARGPDADDAVQTLSKLIAGYTDPLNGDH